MMFKISLMDLWSRIYFAEYGRTPYISNGSNFYVGSSVYNYGSMDQDSNIVVDGNFTGPTNFR